MVFASSLVPEIMSITEEGQGMREITRRHSDDIYELPMDNPVVRVDVNSPEDLEGARPLFEEAG